MTNEQKQKVLQLLELCIDNSKLGEYECSFDCYPSNYGSVTVVVHLNGDAGSQDERFYMATEIAGQACLDKAIEAIRTLPERAPALIAAKEAARREALRLEYEKTFGALPKESV